MYHMHTCTHTHMQTHTHNTHMYTHIVQYTVYLEILAGRYYGRLLKLWHLAEFNLAVEQFLAIMIFIAKWLIKSTGNLTGLWATFSSVRMTLMMKCNWKVYKSYLYLKWTVFVLILSRIHIVWIAFTLTSPLFSHLRCPKLFKEVMLPYAAVDGELHANDYTGTSSCRRGSYDYAIMMTSHCEVLADEILAAFSQTHQSTKINSPPKFPAILYTVLYTSTHTYAHVVHCTSQYVHTHTLCTHTVQYIPTHAHAQVAHCTSQWHRWPHALSPWP